MLQPWRSGRQQSVRPRHSPVCMCCLGCWMPVSSGICLQRMPDAKCVARKVCISAPHLRNGWTLSPLHALLRQRAPVVITLSLAVFWVLTIRIYTLRSIDLTEAFDPDFNKPFWWNWYGELQNITVLLSPGYSGYLDTNVYKSFCGSFCATVHFSVSFMSWNGLWVSKPCQLIPSLTEGTSKKRLGRLMHPVTE